MEVALEAGAEDIQTNDDRSIDVYTDPDHITAVKDAMLTAGLKPEHEEVSMIASTQVALDEDDAENMMKLLEALEELDDVQNVYSNAEISEDILEKLN